MTRPARLHHRWAALVLIASLGAVSRPVSASDAGEPVARFDPRTMRDQPDSPIEGIDGLCALVVAEVLVKLAEHERVGLDVAAEGPVFDLAGSIASRCTKRLETAGIQLSAPEPDRRRLRLRVRANATSLLALVELGSPPPSTALSHVANIEAPSGRALTSFLAVAGRGLETWQQGVVPGRVLGACGLSLDGPGTARVAVLTTEAVRFLHWGPGKLQAIARVELPLPLQARARAPGATVSCSNEDGWLQVTFAVHDRARSALVALSPDGEPNLVENGADEPWPFPDAPLLPMPGTGLVREKDGRLLVSVVPRPKHVTGLPPFVAATQDGRVRLRDAVLPAGDGLALLDLEHDGQWELARTLPVTVGAPGGDRIILSSIDRPESPEHESLPSSEAFTGLGTIDLGTHAVVVAFRPSGADSALVAFGFRAAPGAAP